MQAKVDAMLEPYRRQLGDDEVAYENHVRRVLGLCEPIARAAGARIDDDTRTAWLVAAVFHDLGIWSDDTWDYIEPSTALAHLWLERFERNDLAPLVARMIREHHGVRSRGPATDPVEVFRRADLVDVWLGIFNFGAGRRNYRALLREYAGAGFHRRLVAMFTRNLVHHPLRPLPMFKW